MLCVNWAHVYYFGIAVARFSEVILEAILRKQNVLRKEQFSAHAWKLQKKSISELLAVKKRPNFLTNFLIYCLIHQKENGTGRQLNTYISTTKACTCNKKLVLNCIWTWLRQRIDQKKIIFDWDVQRCNRSWNSKEKPVYRAETGGIFHNYKHCVDVSHASHRLSSILAAHSVEFPLLHS